MGNLQSLRLLALMLSLALPVRVALAEAKMTENKEAAIEKAESSEDGVKQIKGK